MTIDRLKLAKTIALKSLDEKHNSKSLSMAVADYVLDNNLIDDLESILRDVSVYRLSEGVLDVKLYSAFTLDQPSILSIKNLIKTYFPNVKRIILDQIIDKNLVGGIKLEFPTHTLDLSVKNKLNQLIRFTSKERM